MSVHRVPVVFLAALTACATTPGNTYLEGDLSDDIVGIEMSVVLDPDVFPVGGQSSIELTIANTTERAIGLRLPDRRQAVLLIRDAAGDLSYMDDRTLALPTRLRLGMFERWDISVDWDGAVDLGDRQLTLTPGRYELQVGLRRRGILTVNRSEPVPFEVVETQR